MTHIINVKDVKNLSIRSYLLLHAKEDDARDVYEAYVKHRFSGGLPFFLLDSTIIVSSKKETFKNLNEKGYGINVASKEYTPCQILIMKDKSIDLMKELIEYGADVNLESKNGNNSLLRAALCHRTKKRDNLSEKGIEKIKNLVLFLIKSGLDIKKYAHYEAFNMIYVNRELFLFILSYVEDINHKNDKGETLLNLAMDIFEVELVKSILEKGADPNIHSCYEKAPLFIAINNNCKDLIKLLVKSGADPNLICPETGDNFLMFNYEIDVLDYLSDFVDTCYVNAKNGFSVLHDYVESFTVPYDENDEEDEGFFKFFTFLKRFIPKFNVNVKDNNGSTPLHHLKTPGRISDTIMFIFNESKFDFKAINDDGDTVLMSMFNNWSYPYQIDKTTKIIESFTKYCGEINVKNKRGYNALDIFCEKFIEEGDGDDKNNRTIIDLLIKLGSATGNAKIILGEYSHFITRFKDVKEAFLKIECVVRMPEMCNSKRMCELSCGHINICENCYNSPLFNKSKCAYCGVESVELIKIVNIC